MHSPFAYEAFDSISHQLEDGRRNAAVLAERVSHIEKLVQALGELSHYVQQADTIKGIDHLLQLLQEKGAKVAQAVETTQEHVNTLKQDVTNNLQRIQEVASTGQNQIEALRTNYDVVIHGLQQDGINAFTEVATRLAKLYEEHQATTQTLNAVEESLSLLKSQMVTGGQEIEQRVTKELTRLEKELARVDQTYATNYLEALQVTGSLQEQVTHLQTQIQQCLTKAVFEERTTQMMNQVGNLHQDIVKHREEATKNKTEEWDYHLQLEEAKHQFQIRVNQALVEQIQSLADILQRIETKLNHKPTWRERIRGYFGW